MPEYFLVVVNFIYCCYYEYSLKHINTYSTYLGNWRGRVGGGGNWRGRGGSWQNRGGAGGNNSHNADVSNDDSVQSTQKVPTYL